MHETKTSPPQPDQQACSGREVAAWRFQPILQTYNFRTGDIDSTARLYTDNYIWMVTTAPCRGG